MVKGYCVKCKEKNVPMNGPVINQTARGGYMAKGTCSKCGTKMCAMMNKENAQAAISSGEATKA